MTGWLMGIDIGTSALKSVLWNAHTGRLIVAASSYPFKAPQPGWAEQEPGFWLQALRATLAELKERAPKILSQINAISVTGQMHSVVCVDTTLEPVRPAILWFDARAEQQARDLVERLGQPYIMERLGSRASPNFTGPMVAWIRANEPQVFARTAHIMTAKDWMASILGAGRYTDPSDASGTLMFDLRAEQWSNEAVEALGLSHEMLLPILPCGTIIGKLTGQEWGIYGLLPGTPIVEGCGDLMASLLANGIVETHQALINIGTAAQVSTPLTPEDYVLEKHPGTEQSNAFQIFAHAIPRRLVKTGAILSAGLVFKWLRSLLGDGVDVVGVQTPTSPLFLPQLQGERYPSYNATLRGGLFGLTANTSRQDIINAAYEGVAFSIKEATEALTCRDTKHIVVTGAHPQWVPMLASIIGQPLEFTAQGESSGRGAAMLAGYGVTQTRFWEQPVKVFSRAPEPNALAMYHERYRRYLLAKRLMVQLQHPM